MKKIMRNLFCCYFYKNNYDPNLDTIVSSTSLSSSSNNQKIISLSKEEKGRKINWFPLIKHIKGNHRKKIHRNVIKLLLIGLDNAGKTTLALHLIGETVDDVISTIGFSKYELQLKNNPYKIILYDVGGGSRIRDIWKNYYSLVHGIIFVIDSADMERILDVKQLLNDLASNSLISGKPILIYLNKQDIFGAMDEIDICKFTNVDDIMSKYQCATKLKSISAKTIVNINECQQIDSTIESGLQWLINLIDEQWIILDERVQEESRQQINRENDKMKQRIKKIQQSNVIEVESKVPKMIHSKTKIEITFEKPNNVINDQESILKEINEEQQLQVLNNSEENSEEKTNNNDNNETNDSEMKTFQKPSLKRINKIYPIN